MKTAISSGEPISSVKNGEPVIYMPGTPAYETALQKLYGQPGLPDGVQPVVDMLGRKIKENEMPVKRGELEPEKGRKRVLVFKDHTVIFPELYLRVYVTGPPEDARGFPNLFCRADCKRAESIDDADLVVFTGGPDVNPEYYGEKPHPCTYVDDERDYSDVATYMQCLDAGIPMVGVCRGAQFGAVMHGAKLYQHIDGHQGDHKLWDCKKKMQLERISSVHHQSVIPCMGMEIIGTARESTVRYRNESTRVEGDTVDVEAFFIRDTCFFGVQGHPEYKGYNAFSKWFLDYINDFTNLNEDLEWRGIGKDARLRMKEDYVVERELTKQVKERPTLTVVEGEK